MVVQGKLCWDPSGWPILKLAKRKSSGVLLVMWCHFLSAGVPTIAVLAVCRSGVQTVLWRTASADFCSDPDNVRLARLG